VAVTESARLFVADHASACHDARVFVTNFVRKAQWPGSAEDAALVMDELVANALTHAHSESVIECHVANAVLHLAVHDRDSSHFRTIQTPGVGGGYGLRVVAALSRAWGCEAEPTGKKIWAELS
jgi:anti-sigma regulatory factor (Ser/Thr protein kinase)